MKRQSFIAFLALAMLLPACSEKPSILTAGYEGLRGKRPSPNAKEALAQARIAERGWLREITSRARRYPEARFPNPPSAELVRNVREYAQRYDFDIVSVRLLRPRQLAPRIIVRTKHYRELAQATPAILRRLDPRGAAADDSQGWKYEGFYFEARDEHGIPFMSAYNFWRGPSGGGGMWARSEPLFPFDHF
jgi:hypothetical protein